MTDDIHREVPTLIKSLADIHIESMSLGFQHQIFLSKGGEAYGIGKNTRFQMGKNQNLDTQHGEIFDRYQGAVKITNTSAA